MTLLASLTWFLASMVPALVGILGGLFAPEAERGRVFGLLGLGVGIGGTIGSFAAGPIADHWGYAALFQMAALGYAGVALAALFLSDRVIPPREAQADAAPPPGLLTNRTFMLLFSASVIIHVANSQIGLAKPLIMDGLHFDATAISTAGAIGTLLTVPVPFFIGWLSDRLGRKPFILLIYLTQVIGLLLLNAGSVLWQFWMVSVLGAMVGNSIVVGQALVTDIVPEESLGRVLSLFGATPWIGYVIGFGLSGQAVNVFGLSSSLMLGVGIALLASLLLMAIRSASVPLQPELP